ncbi:MAG: UDP-2,4-diacetamido-2,4,6-trideoxy-beta-L-altropyranose hydrolase [Pseudomonadota bacterium]
MLQVAFRLDATAETGIGHLMRCLALANILRERSVCVRFICCQESSDYFGVIHDLGFPLEIVEGTLSSTNSISGQEDDARLTFETVGETNLNWVILDHYGLDAAWQTEFSRLKPQTRILVIDDLANRNHVCDVLIDSGMGRLQKDYFGLVPEYSQIITGVQYILLRQEFRETRIKNENISEKQVSVPRILISFGGGTVGKAVDITLSALENLSARFQFEASLIGRSTDAQIHKASQVGIAYTPHSDEMAKEIADSDIVIGAAGGSAWERCCLGRASIFVAMADNQKANFLALSEAKAGLGVKIDRAEIQGAVEQLLVDQTLREEFARNAWHLCDGLGAERAASVLIGASLSLKPAVEADAKIVFDARYENDGARYYRNNSIPAIDAHIDWFKSALGRTDLRLLIVELAGEQVAHVRFDIDIENQNRIEIGIALAPSYRGSGLGFEILGKAVKLANSQGFRTIDADVHEENHASRKVFEKAGFLLEGEQDGQFLHYVLRL